MGKPVISSCNQRSGNEKGTKTEIVFASSGEEARESVISAEAPVSPQSMKC